MKKNRPNRMMKEESKMEREPDSVQVEENEEESGERLYTENGVVYCEKPPDINTWPCKFCQSKSKRYITDKPEFDAIPVNASHPVKFKRYRHWRCLSINCRRTFKTSEALDENKKVIPGFM